MNQNKGKSSKKGAGRTDTISVIIYQSNQGTASYPTAKGKLPAIATEPAQKKAFHRKWKRRARTADGGAEQADVSGARLMQSRIYLNGHP